MREYGSNINLPSLDNLFSSEQERQDAKLEKIQILPLTELHPFRNHPFQVRDDDEMDKMVDSIKEYGVMTPAIVRPRKDGGYEMDELLAYKENAEVQIQQLARQRKVLYRQKREPERAAREEKIKSLTQQMKALRHEVYICSDIETDAAEVQEKLRQAELAAQEERNEVKQDEQRRRSSRSDGAGSLTGYRSSH